jgi:hypothetical protein
MEIVMTTKTKSWKDDLPTYGDGTIYVMKRKGDPYDSYVCMGCYKSWLSTAKKMGHKEAACRRHKR